MKKQKIPFNKFGDVAVVAMLAAIIYLAFTPLFGQSESLVASETISAAASAILAAAFTWALLTRQSKAAKDNALLEKQMEILNSQLSELARVTDDLLDQALDEKSRIKANDLAKLHHKLLTSRIALNAVMPLEAANHLERITEEIAALVTEVSTGRADPHSELLESFVPALQRIARLCGVAIVGIEAIGDDQDGYINSAWPDTKLPIETRFRPSRKISNVKVHNLLAITISKDTGDDDHELYERTRYAWRVSLDRVEKAEFVLSIFQGVCKEVYKPVKWLAATTENFSNLQEDIPHRYGFVGERAEECIRELYVGKLAKDIAPEFERTKGKSRPDLYNYR